MKKQGSKLEWKKEPSNNVTVFFFFFGVFFPTRGFLKPSFFTLLVCVIFSP